MIKIKDKIKTKYRRKPYFDWLKMVKLMDNGKQISFNDIEKSPNIEKICTFFGQTLRIQLSDGRLIVGILQCLDKQQNIILNNAEEFKILDNQHINKDKKNKNIQLDNIKINENVRYHQREIGLALVPGKHIKKIEILLQK